jgi:hypothetical protein
VRPAKRRELLRDGALLVIVIVVIAGSLWAARELCRASADCPWTILY